MGVDVLREASWLDRRRVGGYLWLLALINAATLVVLLATARDGIDRNGFLLGTDFLSFWTAGRMLHLEAEVYDAAAHIAAQHIWHVQPGSYTAFFYPPLFLPICWLLGLLSYFPALAAWLAATGAAYAAAVAAWARHAGTDRPLALLLAAFPPVVIAITHGQTALLVAALLGGGALLTPSRPWLAGVCFGLAAIKPQLGLLVPLMLLLTGERRVIASAAITVAIAAAIATLAFGTGIWGEWLAVSEQAQRAMEMGAVGYAKMQSLFAAALLLGAPIALAYALQAALAFTVVAALVWAGWGRRYTPGLGAATLAGAPLATPFVLDYDLTILAFPLIWLAGRGFGPWERLVCALVFVAPAFARPLAIAVGLPIMPVLLVALFALLIRRAGETAPRRSSALA